MWQKLKIVLLVLSIVLLLVLTLRNTEQVEIDLLFIAVRMPMAAGLFIAAAIGLLAGMLMATVWLTRRLGASRSSKSK